MKISAPIVFRLPKRPAVLLARGRRWAIRTGRRVPGPLAVALLAAVVVHGLLLAHGRLQRGAAVPAGGAAAAIAPDDTPELLRFSRRSALPLNVSTIPVPIPPPALLPPPPQATAPGGKAAGAAGRERHSGRAGARGLARGSSPGRANRGARASASGGGRPRAQRPGRGNTAAGDGASSTAQGPSQLAEAGTSLRALRISPGASGGRAPTAQTLWEQATPISSPELDGGLELRRLPATGVRELGLTAGTRLILPAEGGETLVIWLEGDQAWLLRGQAGDGGDGNGAVTEG